MILYHKKVEEKMSKKQGHCSSFAENKERKKKRKLDEEGEDEPAATMEKEDVADNLANWITFVDKQPRSAFTRINTFSIFHSSLYFTFSYQPNRSM